MIQNKLNQFYTKPEVVEKCFKFCKENIKDNLNKFYFIEPAAGDGAFYDYIKKQGYNISGFDIQPDNHKDIIKKDFLKFNIKEDLNNDLKGKNLDIKDLKFITIGNPPFGKNSSLALKFVNKTAKFSDYVCFILPKTFRKVSLLNRVDRKLFLVNEIDLPEKSFIYKGKDYDVPCIFQIWKKEKDEKREIIDLPKNHIDFEFVKKDENPDFAIRRVGVKSGTLYKNNFMDYSESSHYYIKPINKKKFLDIYNKIDFSKVIYNTAGNPSLSKTELVKLYENIKNIKN